MVLILQSALIFHGSLCNQLDLFLFEYKIDNKIMSFVDWCFKNTRCLHKTAQRNFACKDFI